MRLIACILAIASCTAALANVPTLTVRGEATLEVPADQFTISLGSTHTADTVSDARAEVDRHIAKITAALKELGFTRDIEWKTGRYDVTPQWEPRPKNFPKDWKPKIIGQKVTVSISVKSTQLSKIGPLISKASDAGANQIGSLYFSLKNPRTSRQEAIATAAKHAIEDARTLAAASGVSLTSIRQLSLDGANLQPPRPIEYKTLASRAMVAMDFEASAAPDIAGGTVTVTANVTAEWIIDQLHRAEPATSQTQD